MDWRLNRPIECRFLFTRRLVVDDELLLLVDHQGIRRDTAHQKNVGADGGVRTNNRFAPEDGGVRINRHMVIHI